MKRRSISTRERVEIFQKAGGVCHCCQGRIAIGDAWEVEHVIPLAQGGADEGDNLQPAHVKCHRAKTADDAGNTARAKRREARHLGARVSARPLPCGRKSAFKKRMDGTVVRRER